MSTIVHVLDVRNSFFLVMGAWCLVLLLGVHWVTAQAAELSTSFTHPTAAKIAKIDADE